MGSKCRVVQFRLIPSFAPIHFREKLQVCVEEFHVTSMVHAFLNTHVFTAGVGFLAELVEVAIRKCDG